MAALISLQLAKAHLRVGDSSHDDVLLAAQLEAAIGIAEDFTNRKLNVEYDQRTLPPQIRAAILLILGQLYDNESDTIIGRSVSQIPLTAEKILRAWRRTPYGDV